MYCDRQYLCFYVVSLHSMNATPCRTPERTVPPLCADPLFPRFYISQQIIDSRK